MMHFKFLSFLFLFVFIVSCGSKKTDSNFIEEGVMMSSEPVDTCFCDSLVTDDSGKYLQDEKLFTGVCIHNYPDSDQKYMVKGILKGQLHGKVVYYDRNGKVLMEEVYEAGQKKRTGDGAPLKCDCSELEQKKMTGESIVRSFLEDIPFTGKCSKKYPDTDQQYMEASYKHGLLEGYTIFYDKFGNTLYMEKYEHGELLKIIHDKSTN